MLGIIVDDGGILILCLQHRVGHGLVDGSISRLQDPFFHFVLPAHFARDPPRCQLALAVQQQAEELKALQETVLSHQGGVRGVDIILILCPRGV